MIRIIEGTSVKENSVISDQKSVSLPRKSIRLSPNNRGSVFNFEAKRKQSIVKFLEENIKKKETPQKRPFSIHHPKLSNPSELFENQNLKTGEENRTSYQTRFKITSSNIQWIAREREKNMKEKVETLTKELRYNLFSQLEKTNQLSKLRESTFCKKMEKALVQDGNTLKYKKLTNLRTFFKKLEKKLKRTLNWQEISENLEINLLITKN